MGGAGGEQTVFRETFLPTRGFVTRVTDITSGRGVTDLFWPFTKPSVSNICPVSAEIVSRQTSEKPPFKAILIF